MANEARIDRRRALKVIAAGVGTAAALPMLEQPANAQHKHGVGTAAPVGKETIQPEKPKFFNPHEFATITVMAEMIIPADGRSGGATAAGVPMFIDLMIGDSPTEVQVLWRNGLVSVDKLCEKSFSASFVDCNSENRTTILKQISRNERRPRTEEERFFLTIKGLTVDGYYTSEIGIHDELSYKGNAVLKEFVGCTHPEHMT